MNYAQLGAKVKAKYPQYKDINDDELGKRIADKYPEYKAQVTEESQQNLLSQVTDFLIPATKRTFTKGVPELQQKLQGIEQELPGLQTRGNLGKSLEKAAKDTMAFGEVVKDRVVPAALELGAYAVPFGNTIKAKAGLGALSGGMLGASQENANPLTVTTGALTGGVLSPVTGAVTDVGGKVVNKLGEKVKTTGEDLVLRGLKVNKSQLAKFKEKTGKELTKWLTTNKITGNFVEEAASRIDDLQTKFDDLAIRSGTKVKVQTIQDKFAKEVADLDESIIPSVKAKAKDLEEVFNNLQKKYGETMDVADLTKERRQIDKLLKEAQFGLPPEQASYLKAARDTLQNAVQEATDGLGEKSLKQLGLELRDLYAFKKIADLQSGLGKGSNVVGMLRTLMTGAGGTVGGIPGAVVGFGVGTASQNPTVLSAGSRVLQNAGSKIQELTKNKPVQMGLEALQRALRNTAASQMNRARLP